MNEVDKACQERKKLDGKDWKINPNNPHFIICEDGFTLSTKGKIAFWEYLAKTRLCKFCGEVFGYYDIEKLNNVCQHCGADLDGKIYPKKRTEPRIIKTYDVEDNPKLDSLLNQVINDNPKIIEDIKKNPNAIGRLVGISKKILPTIEGGELKARLIKILGE